MATYYVGPGGDDTALGTSWATRLLTLNAAEDAHSGGNAKSAIAAGDTVYVGPGTYRETLTVDVSGTSGAGVITYIGDYDGSHTDNVGGIIRITGSDDDKTATRTNCITATARAYRTFQGMVFDMTTGNLCTHPTSSDNIIYRYCHFTESAASNCISFGANPTNNTVDSCMINPQYNNSGIYFISAATSNSTANLVTNCIFVRAAYGIRIDRVGGITVKNCLFKDCNRGIAITTALANGQVVTVNNNIFIAASVSGVVVIADAELTEDYNNYALCAATITGGTPPAAGANSNIFLPTFDTRWFFEMVSGKGRMLSPFDLASYSQLVNVAGTSPTTTDLRGTGTVGTQREWGALEYDPELLYRRVIARGL